MTWTPIGLVTAQTNVLLLTVVGVFWVSLVYSMNALVYLTTGTASASVSGKEIPVLDLWMAFVQLASATCTFAVTVAFLMLYGGEGDDEADGGQNAFLPRIFAAQCSCNFTVFVLYLLVGIQCYLDSSDAAWSDNFITARKVPRQALLTRPRWPQVCRLPRCLVLPHHQCDHRDHLVSNCF